MWPTADFRATKFQFIRAKNVGVRFKDSKEFRQFLKTSKMGSSVYMPIFASGGMIGQIVAAAQARWTYSEEDIAPLFGLAGIAALVWEKTDGTSWWTSNHPAPDAWYAEEHAI